MTPLLWLQLGLVVLFALAMVVGLLRLLITAMTAFDDDEPTSRTASNAAMRRDLRMLRRRVPACSQPENTETDDAIRANARRIAVADNITGLNTANPHPDGTLARWVWQSSYNHTKAMHEALP